VYGIVSLREDCQGGFEGRAGVRAVDIVERSNEDEESERLVESSEIQHLHFPSSDRPF